MKHLHYCLILVLTIVSQLAYAQNTGTITGKILLVDGQPYAAASVTLIENKKGTLTDEKGIYHFYNVAPGNYHLKVQVLGAPEHIMDVTVAAGQTVTSDYQLPKENVQALQEVNIAANTNKFSKKESRYVARLPLKNLENPQVYNSVSKELMQEQVAIDLGSISKNVPGAGVPMIANQGRVTFRSRGFETEPNARNGVAGAAFSTIDPVNLERIEAIKGPSTTLFGTSISSSYGGLYNRVTKKPYNDFGGEVSFSTGSWNLNRLTVDVNTPVNTDKTALFRLNAATTHQKTFQDLGFTNNLTIAPSFSYQVTDRLSILLDVEFSQEKGTSVVRFNPFTGNTKNVSVANMGFPYNRTFLSNDLTYSTQMMNIFAQANYKISDEWTSQTIISRARSTINGYITALAGRTDSTIRPQVIVGNTNFIATDVQQNFVGDFKIGQFRNRMVVGLDFYNNFNDFDRVSVNAPDINFLNPSTSYRISRFKIDSLASRGGTPRKEKNRDNTYSAYVSDVFNLTDNLLAMASIRVDRYQYLGVYNVNTGQTAGGLGANGISVGPYKQTSISHKMGLVYEVSKDQLSLFGNYMSGFFNRSGQSADGSAFKPEHANQLEFGAKSDLFDHRLSATVSYYDIKVKDILRDDPNETLNGYSIQDGTQLSRGVEVDVTANPFTGFNIVAGYAYNYSKYTNADPSVDGLRPGLSGPDQMINFWMSYRLPEGNLHGFGAGFGGNYGSKSFHTNTQTTKITIPAYTIFDATLFYDNPKYRVSFKVNNLTNEKTWSVRLTPQAPAQFIGSVALKF
ncbi:TonB-dependent receptor [Mucilaginibacter sp. JRF]|nr:TonB-dependent receptor [Mucilaginibacter sp. JRF]